MRPIHKACNTSDQRPGLGYIRINDGFAMATDATIVVKTPVHLLFGESVVAEDEHFYIHADLWARMEKAITIKRDGLYFTAYDRKGKQLGLCKAILPEEFETVCANNRFSYGNGRSGGFPPLHLVWPTTRCGLATAGIHPPTLNRMFEAMGNPAGFFTLNFHEKHAGNFTLIAESSDLMTQGLYVLQLMAGGYEPIPLPLVAEPAIIDEDDDLI